MPGKVQLMRCPIDTLCGDCQKSLAFGYGPTMKEN